MQPTKERNLSSILLNYDSENILFDCGEGVQRQMKIAKIKPTRLTRVIISHLHPDHTIGLPGLLYNLYANEYKKTLHIYGPKGIREIVRFFIGFVGKKIKYEIHEIISGTIIKEKKFSVKAIKLDHDIECYGFEFIESDKRKINLNYLKKFGLKQNPILKRLQEGKSITWKGNKIEVDKATKLIKGKKIAFIWDTKLCNNCRKIAKDADLLISESTFIDNLKQKASKYKHLTAKQAAEIAKKSNVKKLILTHISSRYKDGKEILKEAKNIFKNTKVAKDFMEVEI